jgi:hypothetical protein
MTNATPRMAATHATTMAAIAPPLMR